MKLYKTGFCLALLLIVACSSAYAVMAVPSTGTKKLDLSKYHNVGNIWLRVSNYGFFGSGDDVVPQYPSLEYPGGSGMDYLYQGALWFGAKKQRRDSLNRRLYWKVYPPSAVNDTLLYEGQAGWNANMVPALDTLVTVGFDGDADLYEFLPAYNPLVVNNPSQQANYALYNNDDGIAYASSRSQKRGEDDDGDGRIDEDFVGYTFPLRVGSELPAQFENDFGGRYIHDVPVGAFDILKNPSVAEIWFPLGFMDLSDRSYTDYTFSRPHDDDTDQRTDEDGAPVSEQDYISYYYDYCPFNTDGERDYGSSRGSNTHIPLKIRVRQMSYQWSYDYIKNLVYVEFDVTNMNELDELKDCAMGIYMDSDVGPQTYGAEKASDDKSGYVKGSGYEFAYTYDADGDGGLCTGLVGARVCTPDPENLKFHCWYWKVGQGPSDSNPRNLSPSGSTANEKYWLLTGKNPNSSYYTPLRPPENDVTEYEQPSPNDTRFLFSFYGAQPGTADYDSTDTQGHYTKRWNLAPGKTMKIVVAVFPGDNKEDLKRTARWAKEIYGEAQNLITVILPDTIAHYNPPEPPPIPHLYAEMDMEGRKIELYWDNRSEFAHDPKTVSNAVIGWQDPSSPNLKPGLDSDPTPYLPNNWPANFPDEFKPDPNAPASTRWNMNALANPFTAYRLRHDFQGYSIWGRSGSGNQEDWELVRRYDKVDTPQDYADYNINSNNPSVFLDFGGYLGIGTQLPNVSGRDGWDKPESEYNKFYRYDENYQFVPNGSTFYGFPIYNPDIDYSADIQAQANAIAADNPQLTLDEIQVLQARLFRHPEMSQSAFDALYDPKVIPLGGFAFASGTTPSASTLDDLKKSRLARRFYHSEIQNPKRGVEYYVAVTAYDRGIPSNDLNFLETGRDADANMLVFFPGSSSRENMDNIMVIPNPYVGRSKFDGRKTNDEKGDKSRRLWFINLPERCKIRIYTLAGDLVQELDHEGAPTTEIITISKAANYGVAGTGMEPWDLLSKHNQIIAPGVYLYSVENKSDNKLKVGKFVIIK